MYRDTKGVKNNQNTKRALTRFVPWGMLGTKWKHLIKLWCQKMPKIFLSNKVGFHQNILFLFSILRDQTLYRGASCEFPGVVLLEKYFRDFSAAKKSYYSSKRYFSWNEHFPSNEQILPNLQEKAVNSSSKASNVWPDETNKVKITKKQIIKRKKWWSVM